MHWLLYFHILTVGFIVVSSECRYLWRCVIVFDVLGTREKNNSSKFQKEAGKQQMRSADNSLCCFHVLVIFAQPYENVT